MNTNRLAAVFALLCALGLGPRLATPEEAAFVRPAPGTLVLAGHGELPPVVVDTFVRLGGSPGAHVAVIATGKPKTLQRWRDAGAVSAIQLKVKGNDPRRLALAMLKTNAVWFEDDAKALRKNKLFAALLRDVLARGGVVGGSGTGALALGAQGFGLLPFAAVELVSGRAAQASGQPATSVQGGDGLVGWQIPPQTALVVHRGRRVAALGTDHVVARVPAHNGWPERKRMIQAHDVVRSDDPLQYEIDLMAWIRSARDRQGPLFPATQRVVPELKSGTLVLSGGGRVGDDILNAFIEAAGGKKGKFACVTCAGSFDRPSERIRSYGAKRLREAGCENVYVLHAGDPRQANEDPRLLRVLESADGVWMDGGRTFRAMDALEGTRMHQLMRAVLERGGAVGGSSAGCQVVGEFLLRGDPRTNKRLVFDGYTRGLGLLRGVVLDAHFRQRKRQGPLRKLIEETPQLLGIGVDADAAIVVRKREAKVLGENAVTFFVADGGTVKETPLKPGDSFDLQKRRKSK